MQPLTNIKDLPDIYFFPEYGRASALLEENGEAHWFEYECDYGRVYSMSILRRIPEELGAHDEFDLITPYGYGGPILIGVEPQYRERVIAEFCQKYYEHCRDMRVISEFVRFHPQHDNHLGFENYYELSQVRETVAIDLTCEDIMRKEFTHNRARSLRRTFVPEIDCQFDFTLEKIDEFIKIYYGTMDNKNAKDFYYFQRDYFEYLKEHLAENMFICFATYCGEIAAAKLHMIHKPYIHNHIGGTIPQYYQFNLYSRMTYESALWGQENGYHSMHLGGGLTSSSDDTLLRFKSTFSSSPRLKFHVGSKIYDQKRYDELCAAREALNLGSVDDSFFPRYRNR